MASGGRFYVINRGSGSEGSDEEYVYKPNNVRPRGNRHLPHPPKPLPTPAISTNIRGPRSQNSYPSLSSPSPTTTSSPGANEESTPPPTTPALENEPLPDVYTPTRIDIRPPRLIHPPPLSSSPKRPEISPTDTGRTLILVTVDSERYLNVDITGAKTPSAIRECVFAKLMSQLNILNEADQFRFSIYQTEIGAFAIGTALSDERLFELCRKYGDAKGSLKLLVIDSSLPVRTLPSASESSPQVTVASTSMRPRRRSRSRRGSLSSGAGEQIPEVSAGYEADLDNPLPTGRPHLHPQTSGLSPSTPWPNGVSSSTPQLSRPNTPPPTSITSPSTLHDRYGNLLPVPPPPPPLSPDRSAFFDTNATTPADRHVRTGSDPAQESPPSREFLEYESGRPQQSPSRSRHDGRDQRQRVKRNENDERSDSWVVVSRDGQREQDSSAPPDTPRKSPASARSARHQMSPRYHKQATPYTGRLQLPPPPRNPPPAVPTPSTPDARPQQSRTAGQPVPYAWTVTWKGEEKGASSSQPSNWSRLAKGTRSMDNLRAPSKPRRPPPPLPMSQSSGHMPYGRDLPSSGPKSYESRTHIRPLPLQGSHNHSTLDLGPTQYTSRYQGHNTPTSEPYPRPSSALEDLATSPNQRYQRQAQSPTYGSTLELPELARSPRASSPSQQLFAMPSRSNYDRDGHYGFGSPPRSPVSPRSPRPSVRDRLQDNGSLEPTLTREDHGWLLEVLDPEKARTNGDASNSYISHSHMPEFEDSDSSGKDETGTSLWARPPGETLKGQRGPPLTVQIESPGGVHPLSIPSSGSSEPSNSTPRPTHSPSNSASRTVTPLNVKSRPRGSTFTERESSWAPRPPPEDVYERLEEFFPEHDLDKPLIEATSGGTSPTAVEQPLIPPPLPIPVPPEKSRIKGKKSIRLVAEEHKKRIDRTSRAESSSFSSSVLRKRSTKLWGSKLEEVTTLQTISNPPASLPESPSTSGKPRSRADLVADLPATFKWVRGELIGRGTYGRVYLAMNATTGEMIAVKQVEIPRTASDKNDSRHTTVVQALKLESETLKDLDHLNIVQYLGFEETPENLSIFLEYVPGGSIGSCLLRHGKFDEDVTKSFTSQILDGLAYLHSKGILHRDLKADNILVQTDGTCKISDFGISKRTEDSAGAATAMQGTVFWMAPEVVNPQGKAYNSKIDIWSVGCVVLEMWAGMRPWQGDELVAVMFKLYQLKQPPPVPDDVHLSPISDDFRQRCFAINPDDRPSAAELRKHKYLELTPGWVFSGFK